MRVLAFPAYREAAGALARELGCPGDTVDIHRFPDGESLVSVPPALSGTLVVYCGLEQPNEKLVELYLALGAARDNGAERIILVAPYLCYMRQDTAFEPGQAVSQRLIGELLSGTVDGLITVDPHLHRTPRLADALPHCRSLALSAAPLLGRFLRERELDAVLVGPDAESRQWVQAVAAECGFEIAIAAKVRRGDREVVVELPDGDYRGRVAVLVDDVISSGHTLAEAATELRRRGAGPVYALCSHALFAPGAEETLHRAGVDAVWSSNAIPHASNRVDLVPSLAQAVRELADGQG